MKLLKHLLTPLMLAFCGLASCIETDETGSLDGDMYKDWTDREIILTLVKRINALEKRNDDLERRTRDQQQVNDDLIKSNRDQQLAIVNLNTILRQEKMNVNRMEGIFAKLEKGNHVKLQDEQLDSDGFNQGTGQEVESDKNTADENDTRPSKTETRPFRSVAMKSGGQMIQDRSTAPTRRQSESSSQVAFFVTVSDHLENQGAGQILEFRNVTTNIGKAFNVNTGAFTAPFPGTYVFSVSLMGRSPSQTAHYFVAKNHEEVSRLYVHGSESPYTTTSHTVILKLKHGDDVEIRNVDAGQGVWGDHYSCFSGFLLYSDDGSVVPMG